MEIDLRLYVKDGTDAQVLLAQIIAVFPIRSAVLLKNDGFSRLVPDESTRLGYPI